MLGMKSLWPGASSSVTSFLAVSNLFWPTSMVMPLSRSSSVSSSTQAYMKLCLPTFLDSFSCLCIIFWDTLPSLKSRWPMRVLLPESTWPTTTRLTISLASPLDFSYSTTTSSFSFLITTCLRGVGLAGVAASGVPLPEVVGVPSRLSTSIRLGSGELERDLLPPDSRTVSTFLCSRAAGSVVEMVGGLVGLVSREAGSVGLPADTDGPSNPITRFLATAAFTTGTSGVTAGGWKDLFVSVILFTRGFFGGLS